MGAETSTGRPRRALLTGITGQDGSYLAEFLLAEGYEVHGTVRRSSTFATERIDHLYQDPHEKGARLFLHYGDLADPARLRHIVDEVEPDEVYNLGAQSHVRVSFDQPEYTADVTGLGALRVLEAVRGLRDRTGRDVRLYQASSSEMFGSSPSPPSLATPFRPRSPYACAKAYAFFQAVNYREAYDLYVVNGVLFNHESPRRGETFVTRKVTRAAARIKLGLQEHLFLGNLEARRDWGHARDYVTAMHLMLQEPEGRDYIVATGKSHSVRELCDYAFGLVDLDYRDYVREDPRYRRPSEVEDLCGDAAATWEQLGWRPKTTFRELIAEMMASDMKLAERESALVGLGYETPSTGFRT